MGAMLVAPAVSDAEGEDAEISAFAGLASAPTVAAAGWADNAIHINAAKAPNNAGMGPSFFDMFPLPTHVRVPMLTAWRTLANCFTDIVVNGKSEAKRTASVIDDRTFRLWPIPRPLIPGRDKFVGPTFTGRAKGFRGKIKKAEPFGPAF
jgi:hypothetical protein